MASFEQPPAETQEKNNTELFLSHELPHHYMACVDSLRATSLIEPILSAQSDDLVLEMREGITAMNGVQYELPAQEAVVAYFSQEKFREKISQGFTKLLVVPFGYPLATIRARYEQALLKHHKAGKLLDREGNRLDLDESQPLYVESELDKSDETGDLIYYPQRFNKNNHGGKTKQELLNDPIQPFPGFHILLIKQDLTIPRQGQEKTIGTRTDLAANKSSIEYLKTLQTQPQYRHEQGVTLEDSLVLALTTLHETSRVIDDWENNIDSTDLNIGNYYKPSNDVPLSRWDRSLRQASVYFTDPGSRAGSFGVRVAVG